MLLVSVLPGLPPRAFVSDVVHTLGSTIHHRALRPRSCKRATERDSTMSEMKETTCWVKVSLPQPPGEFQRLSTVVLSPGLAPPLPDPPDSTPLLQQTATTTLNPPEPPVPPDPPPNLQYSSHHHGSHSSRLLLTKSAFHKVDSHRLRRKKTPPCSPPNPPPNRCYHSRPFSCFHSPLLISTNNFLLLRFESLSSFPMEVYEVKIFCIRFCLIANERCRLVGTDFWLEHLLCLMALYVHIHCDLILPCIEDYTSFSIGCVVATGLVFASCNSCPLYSGMECLSLPFCTFVVNGNIAGIVKVSKSLCFSHHQDHSSSSVDESSAFKAAHLAAYIGTIEHHSVLSFVLSLVNFLISDPIVNEPKSYLRGISCLVESFSSILYCIELCLATVLAESMLLTLVCSSL